MRLGRDPARVPSLLPLCPEQTGASRHISAPHRRRTRGWGRRCITSACQSERRQPLGNHVRACYCCRAALGCGMVPVPCMREVRPLGAQGCLIGPTGRTGPPLRPRHTPAARPSSADPCAPDGNPAPRFPAGAPAGVHGPPRGPRGRAPPTTTPTPRRQRAAGRGGRSWRMRTWSEVRAALGGCQDAGWVPTLLRACRWGKARVSRQTGVHRIDQHGPPPPCALRRRQHEGGAAPDGSRGGSRPEDGAGHVGDGGSPGLPHALQVRRMRRRVGLQ